ncbi:LysR-family transcriptional regulator SinR [Salmonella enterica subsp. enterica serovar Typhi]|nr:LysR-family transcriptional regulator SinR [Salmonella enterica subsp. enterica serovar Typhi]CIE22086.1 LysR-family transcriptional regulator SinR [Salmonella enterica subsp. enterica serovar Enteritidis]CEQ67234.1 LysR-family transcriptional regulator SinR [Salmonella enterica subsp. enterica serovar Typhi]CEQ72406.1 LysR-family transcriptional regulator SinR [Salmonella enterica subsp. enterica serovar Typhi]CEQ74402.1 LysR-family transcriptional regulator SinR [Salmonella enterica subsp.
MMELINNRGMRDWMIFIKVAEVGNLSRAARELDISISAVSKSLSRLENSIEVTLLRRDSHHLELTGAGQTAYASMKRITSSFQSLLDELRNPDKIIRGSIKFSAPAIVCEFLANKWIWEFTASYPDTKIYLDSRERSDFFSKSLEFDELVFKSGIIESEDLVYRKISPLKLVLCASPKYIRNMAGSHILAIWKITLLWVFTTMVFPDLLLFSVKRNHTLLVALLMFIYLPIIF